MNEEEEANKRNQKDKGVSFARCLVCEKIIQNPTEQNKIEDDEFICNRCLEQTLLSLEDAWKSHSAFLDAALN